MLNSHDGGHRVLAAGLLACVGLGVVFGALQTSRGEGEAATQPAQTQPEAKAPKPITEVFYYDIVAGKLFPASVEEYPPIATPDKSTLANGQPAGVKANVFSCGKCVAEEWYVGYLETYLPNAKAKQIQMNKEIAQLAAEPATQPGVVGPSPQDMMAISEGHLVANMNDVSKWFRQESPEGAALVNKAMKKCPSNKYPQQCFPNGDASYQMNNSI